MINILPEEGRVLARRAYLFRLVTVATFAVAFICLCAGVLLFPSYVETQSAADTARSESARLAEIAKKNGKETDMPLALAQAEITSFRALLARTAPSQPIEVVLRQRGSGITITQIQYDDANAQVSLSGVANTREGLLAFAQRLRKAPGVTAADLPVNDLARNENARFTITVSFAQTTKVSPETPPVTQQEQ
jgi:hypothetical protein